MMPPRNSNLGSVMPAAHSVQKVNDTSTLIFQLLHDIMTNNMMASFRILFALAFPRARVRRHAGAPPSLHSIPRRAPPPTRGTRSGLLGSRPR